MINGGWGNLIVGYIQLEAPYGANHYQSRMTQLDSITWEQRLFEEQYSR
jgi:hypothetical protein